MAGQADTQARAIVKQMFAVIDGQDGYEVDVKTREDGGKDGKKRTSGKSEKGADGNAGVNGKK